MEGPSHNASAQAQRGAGDVLALGFGTAVAMWGVGYVGTALRGVVPIPVTVVGMLVCLALGGVLTGWLTGRGWRGGAKVGALVAVLNLLILGSLVGPEAGEDAPPVALWLPCTILGTCILTALTGGIGAWLRPRSSATPGPNWTFRLSIVALSATGLLLLAGGLVTSREAGLAVPDWPRSYGYHMFFYPLAKMKGNIYFEHAHRLLGSLVGLTTIAFAAHAWVADRRRTVRVLVVAAVVAVIVQGVMGGLRVSRADGSGAQVATSANETQASTVLRVAHGVSAQLFFAFLAAISAVVSRTGRHPAPAPAPDDGAMERPMSVLLVALLSIQLVLGALLRHLNYAVMLHITFAALVFMVGLATGLRVLGTHRGVPGLRRLSMALLHLVVLQPLLGIAALFLRGQGGAAPTAVDVASTTAHQLTGAALLGVAVALAVRVHGVTSAAEPPMMDAEHTGASPETAKGTRG